MIYPYREMPSKNTQGEKDDGKLFQRKINLSLRERHQEFTTWISIDAYRKYPNLLRIQVERISDPNYLVRILFER